MDSIIHLKFDVVIVGGGPAGIAAAVTAAESSGRVALIDDNPWPGGQIWRDSVTGTRSPEAARWFDRLSRSRVNLISGAHVFYADDGILAAESGHSVFQIRYQRLVLATGARELFIPFPGWTLPNVVGAGGLQALVKSGLPVNKKRIVLSGTGPLLLAVAAYLNKQGAKVLCVCEQAPWSRLAAFGLAMMAFPMKVWEAMQLRYKSRQAPYWLSSWAVAAMGGNRLDAVRISENGRIREIKCDYLACGYHLVPNIELARMLSCGLTEGFIEVDEYQQTSHAGVYCAGEPTGIGGMELSLIEGRIAGYATTDSKDAAAQLLSSRARYRNIAEAMKRAFRLRSELATLAQPDTVLCRCEDTSFGYVRKYDSWQAAKLHTRCGMGPCQGRICGSAAAFLFGWTIDSLRPPVFPVRCSSLAAIASLAKLGKANGGAS